MQRDSDGDRRWTCAFTPPSSCTHETLFKESYQRTNRTNRTNRTKLTVTLPTEAIDSIASVQVFARFRAVDDEAIHENDLLPATAIHSSLQSADQPTASWVSSRVIFRLRNVVAFEINPEARWCYAWNSGATMTQRLTRHLLEAIAVVPCRDIYALKVVTVAASPSFTFTSFRHTIHGESTPREPSFLFQALSQELQLLSPHDDDAMVTSRSTNTLTTAWPDEPPGENAPSKPMEEDDENEIIEEGDSRVLASISDWVAALAASHVAHLIPHWQADLRPTKTLSQTPPIARDDVVSMATQLAWWILTDSDVRQELEAYTQHATNRLGDPEMLRRAYLEWVNHIQRRCDGYLGAFDWSWRAIVGKVASNQALSHRSLEDIGVHWFVAVVRQHVIEQSQSRRIRTTEIPGEAWVCDPAAVQARRLENGRMVPCEPLDVLTIGPLVLLWSQLSSFRIGFDSHSSCLSIQSTKARTGLELLLDHKYRCFETLPNGLPPLTSSLLTAYELGDYIGFAATTHRLHVTLFAWPRDAQPCAYRWHWTLRFPVDAAAPLLLNVRVDSGDVTRRRTHAPPPMETLRLSDKLALVDRWLAQYEGLFPYAR